MLRIVRDRPHGKTPRIQRFAFLPKRVCVKLFETEVRQILDLGT